MKLQASGIRAPLRHQRKLPFRWLTVLDITGLVFVYAYLTLGIQSPEASSFALTLATVGALVWLIAAQFRSLATILTFARFHVVAAPVIGAVLVVTTRMLTGEYFSISGALIFASLWSGWMLAWRLVRQRHLPKLRILAFGSEKYLDELRALPNVLLTIADRPPDGFEGIDVVAMDPDENRSDVWLPWLMHADMAGLKLIATPLIIETITQQLPLEALKNPWAQYILTRPRQLIDWKRAADFAMVILLGPFIGIVFAIIYIIVLALEGQPVIFVQERVGQFGRPFRMYKFRSMKLNAEDGGQQFAARNDPRISRLGSFLRRSRLDEVPQFWNVLKGDMSVIGPRPEQISFSKHFEEKFPLYRLRYNLRPGITGWAQVRSGYADDDIANYSKLRHDLYYVRHLSVALELNILLRTLRVIFTGFGAR